jgi:hypothetical protein
MTISRKLNKPHQPNLIMNNTIISTVTEHKHLGLQLSDDGNWNKHIDMITSHFVEHGCNFIRSSLHVCAVSFGSPTIKYRLVSSANNVIVELISVSMSFMKEYADVVLDTKTQILINKLENVQIEAARIVTVGTRLVSLSNLYIEAGWEKFEDLI